MNAGLLVIILLLGLAFLGFPIYIALGIGTLAALNMAGMPALVLPQKLFAGMNSSSLLAIPFFILAGNIMSRSITVKLIDVANAIIGWIRGSVAVVTVLASALFGAISGSGVATASAIGGITIPAMQREGYPSEFSTAIASISSILGPIIPPSITLIVYASITNVSVSQLFMGSVIPGILLAGSLIVYALVYGKKNNLPAHEKQTPKQIGHAFKEGIWALLMPIIILGGIFGGIFTPTEAAAVAVVYALIISLTVYRDMKLSELPQVFVEASVSTATIMMMVGLSKASSYVVVTSGLPQQLLDVFTSITSNRIVILLLLNLLFLIIGMLMEANAAIIMMTPILTPLLTAFNIDALQFGIVMSFNLCIGLVTPPVGLCLLICNQIAKTRLMKALKAMMPMLLISVIVLMLITYIPALTTWLPSMIKT
ncbi:TRAP transporter large permease [uncultured Dysosmobacter sp.]|uniref:TRAP transporter large permease n=1 Tax=uncultured Dysosmobacter sp. TaxID=2591384 RepID=UPI002672629A|nr:TRAP transporter large permease [uncultured Dysosmobacter sp.]